MLQIMRFPVRKKAFLSAFCLVFASLFQGMGAGSALSSPPFSRGWVQVRPCLRLRFPGDGCRFGPVFVSVFQGMGDGYRFGPVFVSVPD